MRKNKLEMIVDLVFWFMVSLVPLYMIFFGTELNIYTPSVETHYEYKTRLFTDEELHLSPSEFFELCYNENLVVSIDFENFISYHTVYLAYLGDVVYTESHFYDDDSYYSYVINSNYWEFFYNQDEGENYFMIDNYGSELNIRFIYNDEPSDYFIFHVGNLDNFDAYNNFNDWFENEACFLINNLSPSNVLGLIKNELVPDEYLCISYEVSEGTLDYHNFISDTFNHLFNETLNFNMPMWILWFLSYFVFVGIAHLLVDFLLFIPRFAHDCLDRLYHCGRKKGD